MMKGLGQGVQSFKKGKNEPMAEEGSEASAEDGEKAASGEEVTAQ